MKRPPGPKPHFPYGNMPLAGDDPLGTFLGWAREFGDIFYYRAVWLHVYFLNDPDLIESVLIRNAQNFHKDRVVQNSRWFFGQGLLASEGESWLRQRTPPRRFPAPARSSSTRTTPTTRVRRTAVTRTTSCAGRRRSPTSSGTSRRSS